MLIIAVTVGYLLAAAYIYRTGTRRGTAAACLLVLAAVVTFSARADAAMPTKEDGTACAIQGVGVGLAWVGTGLAAETGPGLAVAGASAATASAAWAHACPRSIAGFLGAPPPWVFRHSGCIVVHVRRMRDMPLRWCWSHVRTVADWRRIMRPRVVGYAVAAYEGKI